MKKGIKTTELYPVFLICSTSDDLLEYTVDIPKDKLEWIEKVSKEFDKVQEYLHDKFHEDLE